MTLKSLRKKEEVLILSSRKKQTRQQIHYLIQKIWTHDPLYDCPFLLFLLLYHCKFFYLLMTYFSPLIYPEFIVGISYFSEFRDFHNFYNHKYKQAKGEIIIYIEFGVFIYLYILLISCFFKVSITEPGTIPDDPV